MVKGNVLKDGLIHTEIILAGGEGPMYETAGGEGPMYDSVLFCTQTGQILNNFSNHQKSVTCLEVCVAMPRSLMP